MDYYASPTGLSTNDGTIGSPWDLQTALNNASQTSADTLYLRGGTYLDKFISTLSGGTVQSYPGEWAVIDGYVTTTLTVGMPAANAFDGASFTVADASGFKVGSNAMTIESEVIYVQSIVGNTIEGFRGASGSYNGAPAHANGSLVVLGGDQLFISGSNTTYRDFEVMNSNPERGFQVQPRAAMGVGLFNVGSYNKFINLVIHDCFNGTFSGSSSTNTEAYGCVTYNMGRATGEATEGNSLYMENASGYSRVYETLVLNSFGSGAGYFAQTGAFVGGDTQGSVFANSGSHSSSLPNRRDENLLVGTGTQRSPTYSLQDSHFYHPHTTNGSVLMMGWGAGIDVLTMLNNRLTGGGRQLDVINVSEATVSGNKFYSATNAYNNTFATSPTLPLPDYAWNNNLYYAPNPAQGGFEIRGFGQTDFAEWKTETGFDADSSRINAAWPDTVIVRPNIYEIGRAHIIIYAPSDPSSINVDLATTGLVHNQAYEIRNAFDFFGDEVLTGVYDEGDTVISLPLDGAALNVAASPGQSFTPATTLPDFGVFIVLPGAADASAPGTPTDLQVNTTVRRGATGTMEITWDLADSAETSVVLTRVLNGVPTEIVLGDGVESYTNTGLTIGATYTFYVRAVNASGDSENTTPIIRTLTGLSSFGAPPAIAN